MELVAGAKRRRDAFTSLCFWAIQTCAFRPKISNGETGHYLRPAPPPPQDQRNDRPGISFGREHGATGPERVTWGEGGVFSPWHSDWQKFVDARPKEYGLSTEARVVKLAGQHGRLGGSVGDAAMKWRSTNFYLATAFLAVFVEASLGLFRQFARRRKSICCPPADGVCRADPRLGHKLVLLAMCGGPVVSIRSRLNPLGASVLPLLLIGLLIFP